jgi:hypothetical protein
MFWFFIIDNVQSNASTLTTHDQATFGSNLSSDPDDDVSTAFIMYKYGHEINI